MAKVKIKVDMRQLKKSSEKIEPAVSRSVQMALPQLILNLIQKGISPVKGFGRFEGYSKSYKDQIQGKIAFRTNKQGKAYAVDTLRRGDAKQFRASKDARKQSRANKEKIKEMNSNFLAYGKRIRPTNMRLSGKMLGSFFIKKTSTSGKVLRVGFNDEKAEYHNEGTKKIPRRAMLPTRKGEELNRSIDFRLREIVAKTINRILG